MPSPDLDHFASTAPANRILAAAPADEMAVLRPHLEALPLPFRFTFYEPDRPIEHVYFLNRGVASLLSLPENGMPVEFATAGPEGMVGMPIFLGAEQMASKAFVQIPGDGVRIAADAFRYVIKGCPVLNHLLLRYTLALMGQIAQNAACNRTHAVEERCARWLLMTQDRVHGPSFPLTQEFLAQMLGVRRPTVSIAAGLLAKAGLISYVRGQMTILDREGLLGASCKCYLIFTGEFGRLVGGKE